VVVVLSEKEFCSYSLTALDLGRPADKAHAPSFWINNRSEVALLTELGF